MSIQLLKHSGSPRATPSRWQQVRDSTNRDIPLPPTHVIVRREQGEECDNPLHFKGRVQTIRFAFPPFSKSPRAAPRDEKLVI
ncbi:hypothetical protein N9E34_06915 [Opitutales bacterium]|nr:hypothetical protein [Opitutales bacterium]